MANSKDNAPRRKTLDELLEMTSQRWAPPNEAADRGIQKCEKCGGSWTWGD